MAGNRQDDGNPQGDADDDLLSLLDAAATPMAPGAVSLSGRPQPPAQLRPGQITLADDESTSHDLAGAMAEALAAISSPTRRPSAAVERFDARRSDELPRPASTTPQSLAAAMRAPPPRADGRPQSGITMEAVVAERPAEAIRRASLIEATTRDLGAAMQEAADALAAGQAATAAAAATADVSDDADENDMFLLDAAAAPGGARSQAATDATESAPAESPPSGFASARASAHSAPPAEASTDAASVAAAAAALDARRVAGAETVLRLSELLTVCLAPSADVQALRSSAQSAARATAALSPPFELRLLARNAWLDGAWLPLDAPAARGADILAQVLSGVGRSLIRVEAALAPGELAERMRVLALALQGGDQAALDRPASLQILASDARPDPEGLAFAAVDAFVARGEALAEAPGRWPLLEVGEALDALEEALDVRAGGVLRAISLGHATTSSPRHAVEAAILALHGLRALDGSTQTRQAVAHVVFGLALTGTQGGLPPAVEEAAALLLARIGDAQPTDKLDPTTLRVLALAGWLANGRDSGDSAGPDRLVRLLHRLVRRRAGDGPTARPFAELIGTELEDENVGRWARALLTCIGTMAPGAIVRDGGQTGVIVEAAAGGMLVQTLAGVSAAKDARLVATRD